MLTNIQYRILKNIFPRSPDGLCGSTHEEKSRLAVLLGDAFLKNVPGKTIVDYGCGEGTDAVEMAMRGARRVIGIDIREEVLEIAREKAAAAGVRDVCVFAKSTDESADMVLSVDAFEHFADPAQVLRAMSGLLKPGGVAHVSFGPTWYHPLGGHLFSVFPWAHLMFTEEALIRWRSDFKTDGATHFGEVAGGLNRMSIRRFEAFAAESPLRYSSLELVPIRQLRSLHNGFTREFTTAIVRCQLVKR